MMYREAERGNQLFRDSRTFAHKAERSQTTDTTCFGSSSFFGIKSLLSTRITDGRTLLVENYVKWLDRVLVFLRSFAIL